MGALQIYIDDDDDDETVLAVPYTECIWRL